MKRSHFLLLATSLCLAYAAVDYPRVNERCKVDDDCGKHFEFCNDSGRCKHKPMFPLRKIEIVGWVLYTLIVVFANFSGIAGALPIVIIIAMFNFNMKASIPLSNANIMFAAFIRLLMNCKYPHPLRKKGTILDYSVVTMMFPMITVGSAMSSFVSPAVPDIYILIGYSVIVFGIVIFSIFRLIALIKKESALSEPKVEPITPIQTN